MIDEAARQGLALTTLDDALERHEPVPAPGADWGSRSWGEGGDLRTWSGPAVADLAWQLRTAELRTVAADGRPSDRALRELLALQSSDWAFLASRGTGRRLPARARRRPCAGAGSARWPATRELEPGLRNLAPELAGWAAEPGATLSSQRNVRGASRIRISRAGIPPTTALAGTSPVTTALVPITALSPTVTPRSTQAP